MKIQKVLPQYLAAICIGCASVTVYGDEVADVSADAASLMFTVNVPYDQLSLTIAGGGVYEQHTFEAGEIVAYIPDTVLPDGNYKYELVAGPAVDEAQLAAAAEDDVLAEQLAAQETEATKSQIGGFEVQAGLFELIESEQPSQ